MTNMGYPSFFLSKVKYLFTTQYIGLLLWLLVGTFVILRYLLTMIAKEMESVANKNK